MNQARGFRHGVACLLGGVLLAALPLQALAACQLQTFDIPVRLQDGRAIATVSLNGTPLQLMVDSGAFWSFLPLSTVKRLKLEEHYRPMAVSGYTGTVVSWKDSSVTEVHTVQIGSAQVHDIEFVVGGNEPGAGISGVLGRNFLSLGDTEYDLAQGMVRLVFPKGECKHTNFAYWAGKAPVNVVPLQRNWRDDTTIRVDVQVNGQDVHAMLDSGAWTTSLSLGRAKQVGIKAGDMVLRGRVNGGGAGHAKSWAAPVAQVQLGQEKVTNNRFEIDDVDTLDGSDMLLGIDYFLSHHLFVSRLQGKLYGTWNGGPVFAQNQADVAEDSRFAAAPPPVAENDADGLARRGEALAARGEPVAALADLDRAITLAPQSAPYHLARANVQLALAQPAKALQDLDEALRLEPALHAARLQRAALRLREHDRSGSQADLQALDSALPESSPLRASMGDAYDGLAAKPEALHDWALWLANHRSDARRASVLGKRCWLRARWKLDLKAAVDDCERALDADVGNALLEVRLGWAYLQVQEPKHARDAFDNAIHHAGSSAWPLYGRAQAERQLGQTAAAQQDLLRARQLQPTIDTEVQRAGFVVEAGGVAAPQPASAASAGAA